MTVDVKRIIGDVAARHGVRLDDDDPLVVALTANAVALEDVAQVLLAEVRRVTDELQKVAVELPDEASAVLREAATEAAATVRRDLSEDIQGAGLKARAIVDAVHRAHARPAATRWLSLGLASGAALFVLGVVLGRILS